MMKPQTHGSRKYPASPLLKSSAGLGWSTIAAELRSHAVGETPVVVPTHMELTLAVLGNSEGLVRRTGAGQLQQVIPTTGTIWLTPIAVGDNEITITAALPETLHLYLPTALFTQLSDDFNLPGRPAHSIRYAAGVKDDLIEQIGRSILTEMANETAAGRMLVETASMTLAARLLYAYCDSGSRKPIDLVPQRLGHVRLRRVLDYIAAYLSEQITLTDLARVAGVSTFHFAHMFRRDFGVSPHRYICRMRLEHSMEKIAAGRLSLAHIALEAGFSSQASFTRAFRRATGMTPGEYRLGRR